MARDDKQYRASFLIRSYRYKKNGEIIKNPTYLWEDLFGYNRIDGKGLRIRWVDAPEGAIPDIDKGKRINLNDGTGKADKQPWRYFKKNK